MPVLVALLVHRARLVVMVLVEATFYPPRSAFNGTPSIFRNATRGPLRYRPRTCNNVQKTLGYDFGAYRPAPTPFKFLARVRETVRNVRNGGLGFFQSFDLDITPRITESLVQSVDFELGLGY